MLLHWNGSCGEALAPKPCLSSIGQEGGTQGVSCRPRSTVFVIIRRASWRRARRMVELPALPSPAASASFTGPRQPTPRHAIDRKYPIIQGVFVSLVKTITRDPGACFVHGHDAQRVQAGNVV